MGKIGPNGKGKGRESEVGGKRWMSNTQNKYFGNSLPTIFTLRTNRSGGRRQMIGASIREPYGCLHEKLISDVSLTDLVLGIIPGNLSRILLVWVVAAIRAVDFGFGVRG